jgi:hypothetical protein
MDSVEVVKQRILKAADSDLAALVEALIEVVKERHYNDEGARAEMEQVTADLRKAVGL